MPDFAILRAALLRFACDSLRVARKEFAGFFASPAAFLFLGAFLLATLFVFFWLETFFSRNIADVRPLFKWLPVLLIFLVGALTMRTWSEERRSGTLESLLTSPVSPVALVIGKFCGGLALVALALLLTLPLPISVSLLGTLDWGPVAGGYIATLFLASSYLAIGQFASARTDNPVVALILTCLICGVFYTLGAEAFTGLFGTGTASMLALFGTGSRFESITRGVLDLRDVVYYLSLLGIFLTLTLHGLDRLRRTGNPRGRGANARLLVLLLLLGNFLVVNVWLAPLSGARLDLTKERMHSLSPATSDTLARATEPLLIRAYFSPQTHPLLAPLVPQLRDLLSEYGVMGGKRVQVEFINPQEDKAQEEEAASKYGIQPVSLQVASKYQAGVVSSYFDVVVAYGDQFERLGFRDLIEVKERGEGEVDVALRDPEYAITRAVRKVIGSYQAEAKPFSRLEGQARLKVYVSPVQRLPSHLQGLYNDLRVVGEELVAESEGKFAIEFIDPDQGGPQLATELRQRFGFQPLFAGLADPRPFWFGVVLEHGANAQVLPPPRELGVEPIKQGVLAAVQRLSSDVIKTVALVEPPAQPDSPGMHTRLRSMLQQNARVISTQLADGKVPQEADLLMLLAPEALGEAQVRAIDGFLMQGGSVVVASSPFKVSIADDIFASEQKSGLEDWLAHHGIRQDNRLVLDPRSVPLPVPSVRIIGNIPVREVRMLPYPPFPDVRAEGLSRSSPITASLQQLTFNWAAPVRLAEQPEGRTAEVLASSSGEAWLGESAMVAPNFRFYPETGFAEPPAEREQVALAVSLAGRFESFFKSSGSASSATLGLPGLDAASAPQTAPTLAFSPESARLVLIGSGSFASDMSINILSSSIGTLYTAQMDFMQNVVDWALEDQGLMALRGRTRFARTLEPMESVQQQRWELGNYGAVLAGLLLVWLARRGLALRRQRDYQRILKEVAA